MKLFLLLLMTPMVCFTQAQYELVYNKKASIRLAVLDSGVDHNYLSGVKLCDNPFQDMTGSGIRDEFGHGSNILKLATKDLENVDYCVTIIKIFTKSTDNSIYSIIKGLIYARNNNFTVANLSFGGVNSEIDLEKQLITEMLDLGVKLFVAAGNERTNLSKTHCNYFPACYDDRIISVGSTTGTYSNYGPYIKAWNDGTDITAGGHKMSGTSQATAIETNKFLKSFGR
jgi:hypothetical protein